ncbi:molybdopterin molybdochelatase [Desulfocurvibacter africanus PCS]|uniref:Molybdopterin molybdenumtransferase n=1 Tax=Desulfocurvibacter africanus PCS TaxID=1262666 RepID=M5PTH6_DESAF|nr:gephyrin-like molybdotransferase Glp [Desulfocurvibacter africanus]EMG37345.1 molybdopterin molybdochelatase [Desulfocurvibacter africanus PCS]
MTHGFFEVVSTARFREILTSFSPLGAEHVGLSAAHGRVLAEDVAAREDLPLADRSSMDGYAVRAADTFGASEGNPAYLESAGSLRIDAVPDFSIQSGECAAITTGGILPEGADAVVMIEHTQELGSGTIEIRKSLAPHDNVMLRGEDAKAGETALARGTRLRAQEIGFLAALGIDSVLVHRRPRVAVLSTGDELVDISATPRVGQVRDVNTVAVCALVAEAGAEPVALERVPDRLDVIVEALRRGLAECDMLFLSGGSSVGTRDLTVEAIGKLPDSQILAHGVQVSPGKPTILASVAGKPIWGLPGQVTSAQVVMHAFGMPFLRHLAGDTAAFDPARRPMRQAELARNVASKAGREDYLRVSLQQRPGQPPLALPRLGKSGLLKTMLQAEGLIVMDARLEGLKAGSIVDVWLL